MAKTNNNNKESRKSKSAPFNSEIGPAFETGLEGVVDRLVSNKINDFVLNKPTTTPQPSSTLGVSVSQILSRTLEFSMNEMAVDPRIQALIGGSLQKSIPSVLASGARPLSWASNLSPVAYTGTLGYPAVTGGFGQIQTIGSGFDIIQPMLGDFMAYKRAISDTQKSVYSQTPRADGMIAAALPFPADYIHMSDPVDPGLVFGDNDYLYKGDTLTFDILALLQSWVSLNSLYNGSNGANFVTTRAFTNYLKPENGYVYAGGGSPKRPVIPQSHPSGNFMGFTQVMTCPSVAKSDAAGRSITYLAELVRQLLTSPVVQLTGTPRPMGFSPKDHDVSTADLPYIGIAGASSSAGKGTVSVSLFMSINIGGKAYSYPKLDFRLAFDKEASSERVKFLIPRGATVSGVIQPGFALPALSLAPIALGNFSSLVILTEITVSGSAEGMIWDLSLANPSSLLLKQLLL